MTRDQIFLFLGTISLLTGCVQRNSMPIAGPAPLQSAGVQSFSILANVSGLNGGTLQLQESGGASLSVSVNGVASFSGSVLNGAAYQVSVLSSPQGQLCSVANSSGTVSGANVSITVTCQAVAIAPLYPTSGANWNDYVTNDGSGNPCDPTAAYGYGSCVHGGEKKSVVLPGITDCGGITATDNLNAFNWSCQVTAGQATIVSSGLQTGKYLSDLLNFAKTGFGFLSLSVTVVQNGTTLATTPPAVQWANAVAVSNSGATLSTPGGIYLLNEDPNGVYAIGADKVAVVVKPTDKLMATTPGNNPMISSGGFNYVWIEGNINAAGSTFGVDLNGSQYSVLRGVKVANAPIGIRLNASQSNKLVDIVSANNGQGIELLASPYNVFYNLSLSNNTAGNALSLDATSNNNAFIGGYASANSAGGIQIQGAAGTAVIGWDSNNQPQNGISLFSAPSNTFMEIATANNGSIGLSVAGASPIDNLFVDIAATNSLTGIQLNGALNNEFHGALKVGNNSITNCQVLSSTGLYNSSCTDSGAYGSSSYAGSPSDAVFHSGVSVANAFVAKLLTADAVNDTNVLGFALGMVPDSDWTRFESYARGWGVDGANFASTTNQGACSGICQIWDWSLLANDLGDLGDNSPALLNQSACPTSFVNHRWSVTLESDCDKIAGAVWHGGAGYCESPVLMHAVEILDGQGNGNGLCEAGENCLYLPNIGGYQGSGNLVPASTVVANTETCSDFLASNIHLFKYQFNGK